MARLLSRLSGVSRGPSAIPRCTGISTPLSKNKIGESDQFGHAPPQTFIASAPLSVQGQRSYPSMCPKKWSVYSAPSSSPSCHGRCARAFSIPGS